MSIKNIFANLHTKSSACCVMCVVFAMPSLTHSNTHPWTHIWACPSHCFCLFMSKWIFFSFFILYLFYLFICAKQRSRSLRISYSVRWVGCSFDCFVCNCMFLFFFSLHAILFSFDTNHLLASCHISCGI